jgi:hypothetical protein
MIATRKEFYTIEKYTDQLNSERQAVKVIVQNALYLAEEEVESLLDEMDAAIAELLVSMEDEADSLRTNLEEFQYLDVPDVWAI